MRLIFLIFFLSVGTIFSQTATEKNVSKNQSRQYRFSHLGVGDGLSPGTINCFFKEEGGFLWIGTSLGLNRYNGYEISTFNPDPANPNAIQSNDYQRIFQDPLGNIWVETGGGINIFDPVKETFTSNQSSILKKLKVPGEEIRDILKTREGNYLFIHANSTLTKYFPSRSETRSASVFNEKITSKNLEIATLEETENRNFWILFNNGLMQKLDGESFKVVFETEKLKEVNKIFDQETEIVVDDSDNLWIRISNYGIFYYNPEKDLLKNMLEGSSGFQLSSRLVTAIERDLHNNIWIGTDHGGINVVDADDFSVEYLQNNTEVENSLSHNSITSIYGDNKGIVWVGTFKNGIDYYHPNIIRFPLHKKILSDAGSLPFNDVNVFAEDHQGNLYIGTNGGGLLVLDHKTKKYTQYLNDPDDPQSISSNIIVSLLYDSNGDLWIGTYLGGLNKKSGDTFKKFRHNTEDSTSIAGDNIWELFEDSRGKIWIGTLEGGLDMFNRENSTFTHSYVGGGKYNLHGNYISSIAEDKEGNMWIGTNSGIDVIDPVSDSQSYFSHIPEEPNSLSNNNIFAIYKDKSDNMWIGTQEGLNLFYPETDTFFHYGVEEGLPGEKIIGITEDNENSLWLTSSYGIAQFEKRPAGKNGKISPNFRAYNDLDGLQGNLFNENSIFKNNSGEILVGGLHGYNKFNPQKFEYNKLEPNIIFTSFSLYNNKIETREKVRGRVLLEKPIQETSELNLKYRENYFSIEFAALDFFQPSKNKYRYKLEGVDNEWHEVRSNQRRATYTNLNPGEYEFKVQASNNDNLWNTDGKTLAINILPPFYKTIYAYVFYVILILSILYFARRRIINKHRRNFQIEQEKREAEHLHKINLMKIRFFTNISHEFKTPLSLILSPVEKLRSQDINNQEKDQLNIIHKNAQKLLNLINQILDLGNIKNDSLLTSSKGDVVEFIEEIFNSFKAYAKTKNINLNFRSRIPKYHTVFDMDKLDKIIYNLLSNAIKFTPKGGTVTLEIKLKPTRNKAENILEIKVTDTGIGISPEDKEHIFDRFFKVDQAEGQNESGSGIGLSLVKEYLVLYKGKMKVDSTLGKGTTFRLKIPLEDLKEQNFQEFHEKNYAESNRKITGQNDTFPNVLIIDDSRDFLNYLTENLKKFYNIFIATDGEYGWKKSLSIRPDLIICDWAMPGLQGTDLLKKIREDSRTRHIPFIMLTANEKEEAKLHALKIGVNDYITKPFKMEALHSRVQNLINQRNSFQQSYSKKIKIADVNSERLDIENEDEKLMRKVLKEIKTNYGNSEFSVAKLANNLGVSRSFLYKKTAELFEKSPSELITEFRLARGKELLEQSKLTISEIAFQIGFNNPKYFTKNFKKKFLMLPSEYKSRHNSV